MFVLFSEKCKHRRVCRTPYSVRRVCSYNDKNKIERFMNQCNDYNCPLYEENELESKN